MRQPIWQPLSMIPFFLNLSREMLESSQDQLVNMQAIQGKPYLLSNHEIDRCLKLYSEMNEDTWVYIEQCKRWFNFHLTVEQHQQVLKIEEMTKQRHEINDQILSLVEGYKDHTINKIMEMDPTELAIDVLLGKIDPPFSSKEDPE